MTPIYTEPLRNTPLYRNTTPCTSPPPTSGKSAAWLAGLGEEDEWFCPDCKNDDDIVGGSGKMTKKAMAKGTKDSKRDWGKGFACTGRNKV